MLPSISSVFGSFGSGAVDATPLTPGAGWNGTAGSGFSAAPSDPTRTTAKPACRLLVPPNQYFTDEIVVGVYAAANFGGSLADNLGLQEVRVYFESDTPHVIPAPTVRTFADVNGNNVSYLGWWVTLKRPAVTTGHARVYFEAVAKDATMQNRVIGPYQFSPQASLYTHEIEVNSTLSVVAGSRYQSLNAAFDYLRTQAAKNPRVTITGGTRYDMPSLAITYTVADGWVHVRATVPVELGSLVPYDGTSSTNYLRPKVTGLHFMGDNLTFDFDDNPNFYSEVGQRLWLDGVSITNTRAGTPILYRGTFGNLYSSLWRETPYLTECQFTGRGFQFASSGCLLVRGNTYTSVTADLFNDSYCVVGNVVTDMSAEDYTTYRPALTVQYTGAGATATVEQSGNAGASGRNITFKVDGSTVGTFTVNHTAAGYALSVANDPAARYSVQDLADFVNGLSGWIATVASDAIAANNLSLLNDRATSFPATDAKGAALTIYSYIDIHADFYQMGGNALENVVIADNFASNCAGQMLFLSPDLTGTGMDVVVVNNTFGTSATDDHFSQWAKRPFSHTVIAHNTWDRQGLLLRTSLGLNCDPYCLFANNVMPTLDWSGTPDADLVIADNHLLSGGSNPSGGTGTSIGGSETSVFADAGGGDFSPAGELLANLKPRRVKRDWRGALRPGQAAAGSWA